MFWPSNNCNFIWLNLIQKWMKMSRAKKLKPFFFFSNLFCQTSIICHLPVFYMFCIWLYTLWALIKGQESNKMHSRQPLGKLGIQCSTMIWKATFFCIKLCIVLLTVGINHLWLNWSMDGEGWSQWWIYQSSIGLSIPLNTRRPEGHHTQVLVHISYGSGLQVSCFPGTWGQSTCSGCRNLFLPGFQSWSR